MKKIKQTLGLAAIVAAIAICISVQFGPSEQKNVLSSNVAALSSGEFDPIKECNSWCTDERDKECVLTTNYDFNITCIDMKRR